MIARPPGDRKSWTCATKAGRLFNPSHGELAPATSGKEGESIMGNNLARQLIADHLVEGEIRPGEEIAPKIDQFLTHDMCGPLCALQLEAMGVEEISAP
jgi:hypothetical protein